MQMIVPACGVDIRGHGIPGMVPVAVVRTACVASRRAVLDLFAIHRRAGAIHRRAGRSCCAPSIWIVQSDWGRGADDLSAIDPPMGGLPFVPLGESVVPGCCETGIARLARSRIYGKRGTTVRALVAESSPRGRGNDASLPVVWSTLRLRRVRRG